MYKVESMHDHASFMYNVDGFWALCSNFAIFSIESDYDVVHDDFGWVWM